MPVGPGCPLTLLMSLLNFTRVLPESRGDPAAGSCFAGKTLSVSLFQSAPTESVASESERSSFHPSRSRGRSTVYLPAFALHHL